MLLIVLMKVAREEVFHNLLRVQSILDCLRIDSSLNFLASLLSLKAGRDQKPWATSWRRKRREIKEVLLEFGKKVILKQVLGFNY